MAPKNNKKVRPICCRSHPLLLPTVVTVVGNKLEMLGSYFCLWLGMEEEEAEAMLEPEHWEL